MAKINREQRSPDKKATTRTTKRQSRCNTNLPESAPPEPNDDELTHSFNRLCSPDKLKRTSSRGTNLPFPMMPYTKLPQPNNEELLSKFRALCKADRNIRLKYDRLVKRDEEDMDEDKYEYYTPRYGKFLGKLLSFQLFEVRTTVPMYLVHRGIVRDFPIKKEMSEAKQKANRDRQQTPVDININFRHIGDSEIPVFQKKQITMVDAGDYLTNDDLNVAMNLVGKNVDNVAVVLLLMYQYNTAMFDKTKEKVLDGEEYEKDIKKIGSVLSAIDRVMERKLASAAHLTRSAWILASFADPEHDQYYHQPMRQYREEQRALYLKRLTELGDSKRLSDEVKLRRLLFFHLFVIMSSSQGCKDEDGIERLNLLISGERTGSLSVCIPLRNCSIVKYIDFIVDVLKSGKSQGLEQQRAISFVEIAILCETVWKSKLPSNYRDLCRVYQISDKKARVSLNGIGIIDGVGIDEHVRRFLKEVLQLPYTIDELYSLLSHLDTRTAANVNDNIAEIGQKLNNVKHQGEYWEEDKEWLKDLFHELGNVNCQGKESSASSTTITYYSS
eukprot:scaffold32630_cov61-Skeletonema_dohrnii-CCMP3373.AAC.1